MVINKIYEIFNLVQNGGLTLIKGVEILVNDFDFDTECARSYLNADLFETSIDENLDV